MKKWIALLLVFAMSMSLLCGCTEQEDTGSIRRSKVQESTEEVTDPTKEIAEPADRELLVPELGEDEDILTFRYDDSYTQLYYEKLEEFENVALAGKNQTKLENLLLDLEELDMFVSDQSAIAEILHYCNTKDEDAAQVHLDMTDTLTELADASIEAMRRVYNSDSPFKDLIFEDWTEADIAYMVGYDTEVKEIKQRESEILVEYREMSEEEKEEAAGALYAELAANNNRVAELYGYNNFYEYSYEVIRQRDYSKEEVEKLREYAQDYSLIIFSAAMERFSENYENLTMSQQMELSDFLFESYDDTDYLQNYLDALPEDMAEDMQSMFDGNAIFPKSSKAREGAFTALISGHPFCYFSEDYTTTDTLVHEMGHYYGGLHGDLALMPLDLAEVQSQGNEWLMIVYSGQTMDEDVFQCYLDYRFLNDTLTIMVSVIIDEFEERVYTSENLENFQNEDFEKIMAEVCESYGGVDFLNENVADMQNYWRQVVLENPVYYISYAVSMVPSLDLYFCASEDWDDALEIYKKVTEDIEPDATFLGVVEEAGLATPFDDDLFLKLLKHFDSAGSGASGLDEQKAA